MFLIAKISAWIGIDRPNRYGSIVNQLRDSGSDHKFIKDLVCSYIVTKKHLQEVRFCHLLPNCISRRKLYHTIPTEAMYKNFASLSQIGSSSTFGLNVKFTLNSYKTKQLNYLRYWHWEVKEGAQGRITLCYKLNIEIWWHLKKNGVNVRHIWKPFCAAWM